MGGSGSRNDIEFLSLAPCILGDQVGLTIQLPRNSWNADLAVPSVSAKSATVKLGLIRCRDEEMPCGFLKMLSRSLAIEEPNDSLSQLRLDRSDCTTYSRMQYLETPGTHERGPQG